MKLIAPVIGRYAPISAGSTLPFPQLCNSQFCALQVCTIKVCPIQASSLSAAAALADGTRDRSPGEKIPELRGLVVLELRLGGDLGGEWQDAAVRVLLHSEHLFRFCLLGSTSVNPVDEDQPENNECQPIGPIVVVIVQVLALEALFSCESGDWAFGTARSDKCIEKHPGHNDN